MSSQSIMEPENNQTAIAKPENTQNAIGKPENTQNAIVKKRGKGLLPCDLKEMKAVSDYALTQENAMKVLAREFDKKGKLGLFWDGKVPKEHKRWYYFFTFRSSNKEEVIAEIRKYQNFYHEITEVVNKMCSDDDEDENGGKTIHAAVLILDIKEQLKKLLSAAETGERTTGSSTVCEVYEKFVANHEKLNSLIKRAECVALNESWKKANDGLQTSLNAIERQREDQKASQAKFNHVCDLFERVCARNSMVEAEKRRVEEENEMLQEQQQRLLEDNNRKNDDLQTLTQEKENWKQKEEQLLQEIQNLKEEKQDLLEENTVVIDVLKSIASPPKD